MKSFNLDNVIKFKYNPIINAVITPLNAIGATTSTTLRNVGGVTFTDANTIYVAKTGLDSNPGTSASPVLTIKHANDLMTSEHYYIVIKDSGIYEESGFAISPACEGIYSALGFAPTIKPKEVNYNNYITETALAETSKAVLTCTFAYYPSLESIELSDGNFASISSIHGDVPNVSIQIMDKDGNNIGSAITISGNCYAKAVALYGYFVVAYQLYSDASAHYNVYDNNGTLKYTTDCSLPNIYSFHSIGKVSDSSVVFFYYEYVNPNHTVKGFVDSIGIASSSRIVNIFTIPKVYDGLDPCTAYQMQSSCLPLNNGYIVFTDFEISNADSNYDYPVFHIISSSGAVVYSGLVGTKYNRNTYGNIYSIKICEGRDSDHIAFCWTKDSDCYIKEFDITDIDSPSACQTITLGTGGANPFNPYGFQKIEDKFYCVTGTYGATISSSGKYYIISIDWVAGSYATYSSGTFTYCNINTICIYNFTHNRLLFHGMTRSSSTDTFYVKILKGFVWDWITASDPLKFNGLIFDNSLDGIRNYFKIDDAAATLDIKWCTFKNIKRAYYGDEINYPSVPLTSNCTTNILHNCKIMYNHGEFKYTSNSVSILNCQFVKVEKNYPIRITGAGASIIISHCDFVRSYGGIELISNNGAEILKNNIFYSMSLYSIKVTTALVYTYSINTGTVSPLVTSGATVLFTNPLYINDGSVNESLLDLNLKQKLLGYSFDSPGISFADDSKNTGALDIDTSESYQTWDEITVEKPLIQIQHSPLGNVKIDYKDGSVKSYIDAFQEIVNMIWAGVSDNDREYLSLLYLCASYIVRIYPDPISYPNNYDIYSLVYDKVNYTTKTSNKLSALGAEDFSLTFIRSYSIGNT